MINYDLLRVFLNTTIVAAIAYRSNSDGSTRPGWSAIDMNWLNMSMAAVQLQIMIFAAQICCRSSGIASIAYDHPAACELVSSTRRRSIISACLDQ